MYRFLVLSTAALLASCGDFPGQKGAIESLPDVVREINESGTSELAKDIPGATMKARIDDGDTLVLMMGNIPSGNRSFDPYTVRKTLRPEVCASDNYRQLFEEGGKVRVEMTSNFGKELPAIQFARCG
ncbi:MAG: hypothetical protein AAF697_10050 [Pseudomonadota bacterium]